MDAISRYWRIVYVLMVERGLLFFLLGLFYLLALFLVMVLDSGKRADVILILAAIPACGFAAIASERVALYSSDGAVLGLPRSERILRNGQIAVLVLIIGVPACCALLYGAQSSMAALLIVPAAMGTFLGGRGRWPAIAWIVLLVGARVFPTALSKLVSASADPAIRWGAIFVAAFALHHWLGLSGRIRRRTLGLGMPQSGGRHEAAAVSNRAPNLTSDQVDLLDHAYFREITRVTAGIDDVRISSSALALGLSIATRTNWRGAAKSIGIAWMILFALHQSAKRNVQDTIFIWLAVIAASALFSKSSTIRFAWQSFAAEEALLKLSPRWPDGASVKRLFIELILKGQADIWVGWIIVISPFIVVGWLGRLPAESSVLMLFGTSCGSIGTLLFSLSRPYRDGISIGTVCFLLCAACGMAVYFFGAVAVPEARWLGVGLMLIPLIYGGISFLIRPLQFPVQIIHKSKDRSQCAPTGAAGSKES